MGSGCSSDFLLFADSDGNKFAALLVLGGRRLFRNLEGCESVLCGFSTSVFCDDMSRFPFPVPLRFTSSPFIFMVSLIIIFQHFSRYTKSILL